MEREDNVELLIENVLYSQYYEMNNPRIIKHSVLPKLISELCIKHEIISTRIIREDII
jgi:hypothetical protein